jgi:hypothetical protein
VIFQGRAPVSRWIFTKLRSGGAHVRASCLLLRLFDDGPVGIWIAVGQPRCLVEADFDSDNYTPRGEEVKEHFSR